MAKLVRSFGNPIATAHELVHYIAVVDPAVIFCDPGDVMTKVNGALTMIGKTSAKAPRVIGLGEKGTASLAVSDL